MKKKLLIVTDLYPLPWDNTWGMFNKQQVKYLCKYFDVTVLCPVPFVDAIRNKLFRGKYFLIDEAVICYFPFYYIPKYFRDRKHSFLYLCIKYFCRKYIKNVDIILSTWLYPNGIATIDLAKEIGARHFIKIHGSDVNIQLNDNGIKRIVSKKIHGTQGVISVSNNLISELQTKISRTIPNCVIYNGINEKIFNTIDAEKKEFYIYIGTLKKTKGIWDLLLAFHNYIQAGGKLPLLIIGKGALDLDIKRYIKEHKLLNSITILNGVKHADIASYIKKCKALCLPSYNEGVPNVVLESLACGKPVLVSKVGGIPEIVNEECAVSVNAGDILSISAGLCEIEARSWNTKFISHNSPHTSWESNALLVKKYLLAGG